uniref:MADS-box domain-containing protein n=1 Tax=Kalanchoe fedtschenkoi TaxID=63787 RepID=A0A7N1A506_KALFE
MEEIKKMENMEEIKKIENPTSRLRAYSRRRNNLIKKANRLIKECGVELAIVVISPSGHMSHFSSDHNMGSILERYIDLPLEARYAHDPKLKEKQAILAQLEPIQGMENKSLYLDIQFVFSSIL